MAAPQCSLPTSVQITRPSANYHPSVWGDYFIALNSLPSHAQLDGLKLRHGELMDEIEKNILKKNNDGTLEILELIDMIQRLGVAYRFEKEINDMISTIYSCADTDHEHDLHFVALHFRLLRQQRYHVSSDVFAKFLDENGDFVESLKGDIKGMLSLYEAAHFGMPGEEILDKAIGFTEFHLNNNLPLIELDPELAVLVSSALDFPLAKRIDRPKAKSYLSIYENDEITCNKLLLEFAKMDFALLQAMHQDEARSISMWWKDSGYAEKLPFARDRVMECYFWVLSVYHEPCYSRARLMMTKIISQISVVDDIYDLYGTSEELQIFTDAFERWELESAAQLPEYMKLSFLTIQKTFKDFEAELAPENNSFRKEYLKNELKQIVRSYLQESKWARERYIPKLEDHLKVTLVTAGYSFLTCASYMGMHGNIPREIFDWITSLPDVIKSSCIIGRLMNDIVTYELEQKRNHVASTIQCYVMEHGCLEEEACKKLMEMVDDSWKIINREYVVCKNIPLSLMVPAVNLARFNYFVYKGKDIYTHADEIMRDNISKVLIEPIKVNVPGIYA
ncbi:(-)-germacrene D synthase [Apostasia shenzhenica]|uniref:(-)-germacrene D synthase n=1 Tax=Apostasia shenzhenica TaxID=1088818 RepID=A0A2I0ABC5_9ASPA|nr:(-)-germacrene D synthase [Apostasia shenzhenica]